jgi:hypothetical protein
LSENYELTILQLLQHMPSIVGYPNV